MTIGVCYFPEHWPRERWETDIEAMADAGIEYVRMGEFAWSAFETKPGEYDFDWLETVVDLIADHGMNAVLCTPTAAPPKWLSDRSPEILQEEADGTKRVFGGRCHYCFNSAAYWEETERIVSRLASHFAAHDGVVGWQTDNEYGCHDTVVCYCDNCASAFREWLEERYGDIETLNETWGTMFWSQHHNDFSEIDPPRHTAADHHPSRLLDYQRFSNDSIVSYNRHQTEILREHNDNWFVTHNFMYNFDAVNPFEFSDDLDFAVWDSYPTGFPQVREQQGATLDDLRIGNPDGIGLNHDLYRCAADGPFWIMEQQPGDINWPPVMTQPADGAMRLWAHHAVAHGAAVVSFFRWRRCLQGQEQYHAGLLERDGSFDRGYHDAARAASELDELPIGAEPSGSVAIIVDHQSCWALEEQPMSPSFDYWDHVGTYYRALRRRGLTVDVVPPDASLESYHLIVAPTLYLVDERLADRLESRVSDGAHLLLTIRSGVKTIGNQLHAHQPPGPLADLTGSTVADHESVVPEMDATLEYGGKAYSYRTWAEWLSVEDASAIGNYTTDQAAGHPAITRNEQGKGSVHYVGVYPTPPLADEIVGDVLDTAGLSRDVLPERVRIATRNELSWVFNFSETPVTVENETEPVLGSATVPGYDLAVFDGSIIPSEITR